MKKLIKKNTSPKIIGDCPYCSQPVYSKAYKFHCQGLLNGYCDFSMAKNRLAKLGKKTITDSEMSQMLQNKVVYFQDLVIDGEEMGLSGVIANTEKSGWSIKLFSRGFFFHTKDDKLP